MSGKKSVLLILILGLAALLAGCNYSSSSSTTTSNTPPPTGLKKRVLVSNQQSGVVVIIDALKDVPSTKSIAASGPTKMVTAGGQTAIIDSSGPQVSIFDNATEATTFAPLVADTPTDIVITPDGKTVWVAERNNGFVQSIDTATGIVTNSVPVPSVRRLVLSPNGTLLLAFSDNPQGLPAPNPNPPSPNPPNPFQDAFFVIDTAAVVNTHQATPVQMSPGDQPFTAVFNASETQAFILNCGSGCGGTDRTVANAPTPPSIALVDFTNAAAPVIGSRAAVPAATAGLLQGGNLYVAGTTSPTAAVSPGTGFLQVVDAASLTPAGTPVQITDGLTTLIVPTANNRLYIGSQGCTPGPIQPNNTRAGCLTIANITSPASPTVTVPVESSFRQNFDVTAIQPISGRSVVYVVEGGEIDFFDANTDAVSTAITPIDIIGKGFGAVQIDP
ncbi:MAG: YncE family protein [Actinomycetota bacterium]